MYTIETDIEGDVGGGHDEHGPIRQHWEVFWVFSTPGFGCRLFALKGILADVWMHNIKVLLEMIQDFSLVEEEEEEDVSGTPMKRRRYTGRRSASMLYLVSNVTDKLPSANNSLVHKLRIWSLARCGKSASNDRFVYHIHSWRRCDFALRNVGIMHAAVGRAALVWNQILILRSCLDKGIGCCDGYPRPVYTVLYCDCIAAGV